MGTQIKYIILIVEGITDKDIYGTILTPFLERLSSNNQIRCRCTNGDLFSDRYSSSTNIQKKICKEVKDYIEHNHLNSKDIEAVIQICDIDGIFIPKERFIDNTESNSTYGYNEDGKLVRYCDSKMIELLYHNYQQKRQLLEKAHHFRNITINKIKIPYRLFYQSIFLENLLDHQFMNAIDDKAKKEIVNNFIDNLFFNDTDEKIIEFTTSFFKDKLLPNCDNYNETWSKLDDTNCLSTSNLYLLIDSIIS